MANATSQGKWVLAPHLDALNVALVKVAMGKIKRLMVTMPPRHGKSELASRYFPAWYLGMFPDRRIILSSYADTFSAKWGRKARELLSEFGPELYGIEIASDSRAADRWDIVNHEGGMLTAGIGGSITGQGAHVLIIDDPVKDAVAVLSPTVRAKNWDWYQATASTRLEPDGCIILIQTRWHNEDLAGKVLAESSDNDDPDERWHCIDMPALCVDPKSDLLGRKMGEALWPARFNERRLMSVRERIGQRWFGALYQQQPVFAEGNMFSRSWFDVATDYPRDATMIRYWDLAATKKKQSGNNPDWTAGALVAHKGGRFWIVDVQTIQESPRHVENLISQTAALDGAGVRIAIEQEGGSSGVNLIDHYRREVLVGFAVTGVRTSHSKEVRAQPFSSASEAGNVTLIDGAWLHKKCDGCSYFDELEQFPFGSHDDRVDATFGAHEQLTAGFISPSVSVAGVASGAGRYDPASVLPSEDTETEDEMYERLLESSNAWS